MVAGSFFLTPATALRYEKHDRKVRQMSKEEALGIGRERRKVDMAEEYYVSGSVLTLVWARRGQVQVGSGGLRGGGRGGSGLMRE